MFLLFVCFGIVFVFLYCFFGVFGIVFFAIGLGGVLFVAIQVLMQSAPLLHKLDNVVHEDEYLAPEEFRHVGRAVHGRIASRPTNGRN